MEGDDSLDLNICSTGAASNIVEANLMLYPCQRGDNSTGTGWIEYK